MAERLVRAVACLVAGEGGSSSSSSSESAEEDGGEEDDEGGDVEKAFGCWRFLCCFEWWWCDCSCVEEEGREVDEAAADDIRGVVALSVMCMASEGCCEGRLAMSDCVGPRCPCFESSGYSR